MWNHETSHVNGLNLQERSLVPWREVKELEGLINQIGTDPHAWSEHAIQEVINEMERTHQEVMRGLEEAKREILNKVRSERGGREWETGYDEKWEGLLNLEEMTLPTPEWEINFDEAAGEEMANSLRAEAIEWEERAQHIFHDW